MIIEKMRYRTGVLAAAVGMVLAGCSGSSSTGAGTAGSNIVSGVITGFGSVYVNGVEYETDGASISLDGVAGSEQELGVGMVVTLEGSSSGITGTATSISYVDDVEGSVIANNVATDNTLDVMGRTVLVNANTVFDANDSGIASIELVSAGNIVEVSGYPYADGTILATRIEVKALSGVEYAVAYPGMPYEMKGVVSGLNTSAMTFSLGSLTVDYSVASSLPLLSDGLFVEVKSSDAPVGGVLLASEIEIEDDGKPGIQGGEGEEVEMRGVLTDISMMPGSFELNGQTVYIDSGYSDEDVDLTALETGMEVTIEGHFDSSGQLWLDGLEEGLEDNLEFAGVVESVDALAGTVTMFGQTFIVDSKTMMLDDDSATEVFYFDIGDIQVGDYLEVHLYQDPLTGGLRALRLQRDDNPSNGMPTQAVEIKGLVDGIVAADRFTVAGIVVQWSGTMPVAGDKVEVTGSYANTVLTATGLAIEM